MNGLTKGVAALAIGLVVLLGVGGSLALWNVSASSEAGSLATGDLNLVVPATGQVWEVATGEDIWEPIADIDAFRMVPGDTVRLTQSLDVTLKGDNMQATLSIDTSNAITAAPGGSLPGDLLTVTSGFSAPPAGEQLPVQVGSSNVWLFASELSAAGGNATFVQQVTFAFSSAAADRDGALATIDLANTNFVLAQVYEDPTA